MPSDERCRVAFAIVILRVFKSCGQADCSRIMVQTMSSPRRIHITSRFYIQNFGSDGKVMAFSKETGETERRNPVSVGWRNKWWGRDGELSAKVEAVLEPCETAAAPILLEFADRWPLNRTDRTTFAQLAAIHTVRGPAWHNEWMRVASETVGAALRNEPTDPTVERGAGEVLFGNRLRIDVLTRQIPRVASLFASMHWSLISFDKPLLASGDQPIVVVPFLRSHETVPIEAIPRSGFLNSVEIRLPISPYLLLLMTWLDDPETGDIRSGTFAHAADVNRTTLAQADVEWFFRPGTRPPRIAPPLLSADCEPISYSTVPGYTSRAVHRSRRRSAADQIIRDLIATQERNTIRWANITATADAA